MRYRNFLSVSTLAILGAIIPAISFAGFGDFAAGLGSAGVGGIAGEAAAQEAEQQRLQNQLLQQQNEMNAIRLRQMQEEERQQQVQRQQRAQQQQQNQADAPLKNTVIQINAASPKMIDAYTRLDGASFVPGRLTYYYTIVSLSLRPGYEIDAAIKAKEISRLHDVICESTSLRPILSAGVAIEYAYRDRNGVGALNTLVSMKDCLFQRSYQH